MRRDWDLSLREFARRLQEEVAYDVSYSSVRDYEREESSPPAPYVEAVSRAFDVDPLWLLQGDDAGDWRARLGDLPRAQREIDQIVDWLRSKIPADDYADVVEDAWRSFIDGSASDHPVRDVVLRSWERSAEAGVPPDKSAPSNPLPESKIEELRREKARLVTLAERHLDWLELLLQDRSYVLSVADEAGRILISRAADQDLLEESKVLPGYDWSEESMGTSGPGLALEEKSSVVLIGAEHYARSLHDIACLGCPIIGEDDELVGVMTAALPTRSLDPLPFAVCCYSAWMISEWMVKAEGNSA